MTEIPSEAKKIIHKLKENGYEAFLVGGCVRDMILQRGPNDWDICTSATPNEVHNIGFDRIVDTGLKHGTVTIIENGIPYEVTTYRIDGNYSDGRRPDSVQFTKNIVEDLSRRDFTMNAIAYDIDSNEFIDPFDGVEDIKNKTIQCVGNPLDRFAEDQLRILRAVRFSCQLGFGIDLETCLAFSNFNLDNISKERIWSEFLKIIDSEQGYQLFNYLGLLFKIFPELEKCYNFNQCNRYHCYDLLDHISVSFGYSSYNKNDRITRLAVFFHDIGKPMCQTFDENGEAHYYGHAEKSAEIAKEIFTRYHSDTDTMEKVCELIKYHDSTIANTKPGVRRWLNKIGEKQFIRLLNMKQCDISAQCRKYYSKRNEKINETFDILSQIHEEESCFKLKDLAINGKDLINIGLTEGKTIGKILNYLLDSVIEDPTLNKKETLLRMAKEYKEV